MFIVLPDFWTSFKWIHQIIRGRWWSGSPSSLLSKLCKSLQTGWSSAGNFMSYPWLHSTLWFFCDHFLPSAAMQIGILCGCLRYCMFVWLYPTIKHNRNQRERCVGGLRLVWQMKMRVLIILLSRYRYFHTTQPTQTTRKQYHNNDQAITLHHLAIPTKR